MTVRIPDELIARPRGRNRCWLWRGDVSATGVPRWRGASVLRLLYAGDSAPRDIIRRGLGCDPRCIRPAHLVGHRERAAWQADPLYREDRRAYWRRQNLRRYAAQPARFRDLRRRSRARNPEAQRRTWREWRQRRRTAALASSVPSTHDHEQMQQTQEAHA
jgi:hypothetical protein